MQQDNQKQTEQRSQYAPLVEQYRSIGPAAILAALLHTTKRKTSILSKAA